MRNAPANLNPHIGHQASNQFPDAAEVSHFDLSKLSFDGIKPIEERGQGRVTVGQGRVIPRQGGGRRD